MGLLLEVVADKAEWDGELKAKLKVHPAKTHRMVLRDVQLLADLLMEVQATPKDVLKYFGGPKELADLHRVLELATRWEAFRTGLRTHPGMYSGEGNDDAMLERTRKALRVLVALGLAPPSGVGMVEASASDMAELRFAARTASRYCIGPNKLSARVWENQVLPYLPSFVLATFLGPPAAVATALPPTPNVPVEAGQQGEPTTDEVPVIEEVVHLL